MKKWVWVFAGILGFCIVPGVRAADKSPLAKGGHIGIGLVVGEPGDWGASGKIWLSRSFAFQPAVNFEHKVAVQGDLLWHYYGIVKPEKGAMPLYIGVGAVTDFDNLVGVRGPGGIAYHFADVPVDLFVELVPTLWFAHGESDFKLDAGLGSRFYF
jgi:hypothetical protein